MPGSERQFYTLLVLACDTTSEGQPQKLFPTFERIDQLCSGGCLGPNNYIASTLELDQIRCCQRILTSRIELYATIPHHELLRLEVGLLQCLLDRVGLGRASPVDGVGENE